MQTTTPSPCSAPSHGARMALLLAQFDAARGAPAILADPSNTPSKLDALQWMCVAELLDGERALISRLPAADALLVFACRRGETDAYGPSDDEAALRRLGRARQCVRLAAAKAVNGRPDL